MLWFDKSTVVAVVFLTFLGNHKPWNCAIPMKFSQNLQHFRCFGAIYLNKNKKDGQFVLSPAPLTITIRSLMYLLLSRATHFTFLIPSFRNKSKINHNMIRSRLINRCNQFNILISISHINNIWYLRFSL